MEASSIEFAQMALYGFIVCPVCDERFIAIFGGLEPTEHIVNFDNHGAESRRRTCGGCGDWSKTDVGTARGVLAAITGGEVL